MSWAQLGYAVAALIGLALLARRLRLGESRISSEAKARETAEQLLAGFVAHQALLGTDGNAALVGGNHAIAVLKRQGVRIAARRLIAPLRLTQDIEGIRIETGERLFGGVLLFGVTDMQVRALESAGAQTLIIH